MCVGREAGECRGRTSYESAADSIAAEGVQFLLGGVDEPQEFTFEVPDGTEEVEAILTWTIPGATLDFQLLDPTGTEAADGWGESDTHRYVTTTAPPTPGTWTAIVSIQQGADAHYTLQVTTREAEPFGPIEHTGTALKEGFTAPATEVYSLLWRNEGILPVEVTVSMDGTYRLHSMTRNAPPP